MLITDKSQARKYFSQVRKDICDTERINSEKAIFRNFIASRFFKDFDTILCYVSVNDEVDTKKIIKYSLDKGKKIYIPKCVGKRMFFYELKSLNLLIKGEFGIPTVNTKNASYLSDFNNVLCLVPALSFDKHGNRIGYGGGYYDRFLTENNITALGLTFDSCFCDNLPSEEYDVAVDAIITESGVKTMISSDEKEGSEYE